MTDLDFITDAALRRTIEDSVEHAYVLYKETKEDSKSTLYKEETYRVIILYTVAVIEAVLLHLYKKYGEEMTYLEYKFIKQLPPEYRHASDPKSPLVVAVQKNVKKAEHQITMSDLVAFFKEKKFMKPETAENLLRINNLRNTFHLNKPRAGVICDIAQVESALQMLVHVIQNAPKSIPKVK